MSAFFGKRCGFMDAAASPEVPDVEVPAPAPLTPMMKQYLEVKAQVPDAFLFFRLGDFYEMFFEDAVKAADLLRITLTARSKGADKVPMCGVPYHAARRYVRRLIDLGHKVAICEQVEEAGGPAIVRREVVRVVTPGMVLDEDVLEATENNYLLAVSSDGQGEFGAALLDASTGEFFALEPGPAAQVAAEISRFAPKEALAPESLAGPALEQFWDSLPHRPSVTLLPKEAFDVRRGTADLTRHFQVSSLDGFGLAPARTAIGAAAAALRYAQDTQKSSAAHIDRVFLMRRETQLLLDDATIANLELTRTLQGGARAGSLLAVIDKTVTPLGARRLNKWLLSPLRDVSAIALRLDAVERFTTAGIARETLAAELKSVGDIERLAGRVSFGTGGPRDLRALGQSLQALPSLSKQLRAQKVALLQDVKAAIDVPELHALGEKLGRAIVDEPAVHAADGGFVRPGYDAKLDEVVALSESGKDYLVKLEASERARTGIASLKVRYNGVFGYFIEVTKANLHLVPKDYVRRQTMVNAERFVTEPLKAYEEKVLTADAERLAMEQEIFAALKSDVVKQLGALRVAADALATLDALVSFARVATEYGYSRPVVDTSETISIEGGRHPVVERLTPEPFVPNDVVLDRQTRQLLIVTGPNMAGKSTVMRQVALTVILAQAGSFVPARRAQLGVCDRVFTRVGAADNLARGQSTFMVEMTETANILHHATPKSLVVLDEIGRGTSTFDGVSIAWAVAEHLCDRVGAKTLFATHYHELTALEAGRPKVKNCSVAVMERGGKIMFLRKLVEGGASRSYGIEVARLAGLPTEVLARARVILKSLEKSNGAEVRAPVGPVTPEPAPAPTPDPWHEALLAFDVNHSTPMDALAAVARWQAELKKRHAAD